MWQVAARMMKTADPAATVKTNAPRAQAPRMRPTAALHHSAAQALRPPAGRRCSRPGFLEQAVLLPGVFRIDRHGNRPRSEGSSVAIPSIAIIERFPSSSHGRAVLAAAADIVSWGCGGRRWWVVGLVRRGSYCSCSNGAVGPPAALGIGGDRPHEPPVTLLGADTANPAAATTSDLGPTTRHITTWGATRTCGRASWTPGVVSPRTTRHAPAPHR